MQYRSIVITGASKGLGEALANAYAEPGRRLGLVARGEAELKRVARSCSEAGAIVEVGCFDIRDTIAHQRFLTGFKKGGTLDLAICNAGAFSGRRRDGRLEPLQDARDLIDINLTGTIVSCHAITDAMDDQNMGRIALVSSLAAPHPAADAPAYSAAKAGIAAYGEALRELLAPRIGVTVILPGHIATAQTAIHDGALPMIVSAETAAQRIIAGLDARANRIVFPRRLHWLGLLGRCLPDRLRWRLNTPMRFSVRLPEP